MDDHPIRATVTAAQQASKVGNSYVGPPAHFGPVFPAAPIVGELVAAEPFEACKPITNDVVGKIGTLLGVVFRRGNCWCSSCVVALWRGADSRCVRLPPRAVLVERGACFFAEKVEQAQKRGARAVIVGNTENADVTFSMVWLAPICLL